MCGEKGMLIWNLSEYPGSPPRVRGKAPKPKPEKQSAGITPACAGKRGFSSLNVAEAKDHPRVCGEKGIRGIKVVKNRGSPPRVRGKVVCQKMREQGRRITPACAGKRANITLSAIII